MNKLNFNFNIIEKHLLKFQKPARYIGNEIGIPDKNFINSKVRFVIGYPDIYEIGMSNQGIKILYDRINKLDFASCERVFSPWTDFEDFLKKSNIPLFSLETKTPIKNFDFVGISIQYELLFSNFLNLLKLGQIELFAKKRKENDPIIICGGPAIVNPAPYSPFIDLVLIGEGEDVIEELLLKYNSIKSKFNRETILKELSNIQGIYSPIYSKNQIKRQYYHSFTKDKGIDTYIIPNIDIIQNKCVIEIMRGCPNKCRFCQAGVIYKPSREKSIDLIMKAVDDGINKLGTTEVTLSSLSSGDYSNIIELTERFLNKYSSKKISFSLPSIRVETFNINLLKKISSVRKSGLTFAIESGSREGQLSINKPVLIDKINEIIKQATNDGWKVIKLYFMIGLPHSKNEKNEIISFLDHVLSLDRRLNFNVNIAVFVPKPHTPYQYEKQMSLEESIKIIDDLRKYYYKSKVKIKSHNPYMSYLEGFIARGDSKIGFAVYDAVKKGARFDGWEEFFNFNIYSKVFKQRNITYDQYLGPKEYSRNLIWDNIDVGLTKDFYLKELDKSKNNLITDSCKSECDKDCKICDKKITNDETVNSVCKENIDGKINIVKEKSRYLLEFSKVRLLRFISHIDLIKYFERLFIRADIPIVYSEGFNPHAKMQFASAISLGLESECELLEFYTNINLQEDLLLNLLNKYSHNDLKINRLKKVYSEKKISLFEKISYEVFSIRFNNKYYNKIKAIYNNYKKRNIKFNIEKSNRHITDYYQNYIELYDLNYNNIKLRFLRNSSSPKLLSSIGFLFKNIELRIIKEKIYSKDEYYYVELYDSL